MNEIVFFMHHHLSIGLLLRKEHYYLVILVLIGDWLDRSSKCEITGHVTNKRGGARGSPLCGIIIVSRNIRGVEISSDV